MKKALFVLMLAAAAFVGCQKQEAAAPAMPAAQDQTIVTSTTTVVAPAVTPAATPAAK
jgi:nitrous oxide reductase accessory protein NosL